MSASQERPEQAAGARERAGAPPRDRASEEPVVTTTSAERYVMGGGRAARLAIKEGDLFLYSNELGQVPGTENSALGLYYRDTRYLSRYELTIAGRQPVLLSASADRGYAATVELTNLEARTADGHVLPQATVHVRRTRFVADRLYELLRVQNYHEREVELVLDLHLDSDFADLFEVRGSRRRRRGQRLAPATGEGTLTLSYLGLDEVTRQTVVRFHDRPESIKQGRARFRLRLPPGGRTVLRYDVQVVAPEAPGEAGGEFNARIGALRHEHERWESDATDIFTDNEELNRALRRGQQDLRMLSTVIDGDRVPLAGAPWFVAPFGREMAFVGLETLLLDLRWARAAVSFLARRQGVADNAFREEQPGKIMHELRRGELAAVRAVPHTPYFGSVDATALWLLLVAELAVWTGDLDGFELRTPAIDAALAWIDGPGDLDGDGFIEYERRSRVGLRNQGWRDSQDAVMHADGSPVEGPVALAETQGYVYYAKRRLAAVFGQLGDVERAERLSQDAARLKHAFNERFWMEDQGYYAMALDGQKRQVEAVSSTIGHALWSRIVAEEHIPEVVHRLMAPDMSTGWGIRTLSKEARFYNPVSFYNGSVWPFDTALIANGLKKHGYVQEANRLAWGLVEAAAAHEYARLPEMYCGFTRHAVDRPVSFPMACSPDSNSAAALFLVLQSMVGIYAQAEENIVYVHNPVLPRWLGEVTLSNLRVGRTTMRLRFRREGGQTSFSVLDKQGPGRIVVVE
ncbi:MAG TPA: glycogen debranching N-terminal domain-containing protein [Thermoleophilia bacterium]|nr:glycogen debranching N-terminal domain-containing protein [Thermoleophilia bacterium]